MMGRQDFIALACKMIDTLGPRAATRMDEVVKAHVDAGDAEGAQFWGEVAATVRRLQDASERAAGFRTARA